MDTGGTFTDICVFDEESGATRVGKVSSTRDPIGVVFEGMEEVGVSPGEIGLSSHGTTVATNALITRRFSRTAMVTTKGFRDVIEIRRVPRQDLWDAYKDVATPCGGVVVREVDAELAEWEADEAAKQKERSLIRESRVGWPEEEPEKVAGRYRSGEIGTLEAIRRHGVILDWGTGELLPNTTEVFRAMLHRRSPSHWKNGEANA